MLLKRLALVGEDLHYLRTALRCRSLSVSASPSIARVLKTLADDCEEQSRLRSAGWFRRYPPLAVSQ